MSIVQIAHGWNVRMGFNETPVPARVLLVAGSAWTINAYAGFAGFNGPPGIDPPDDYYDASKYMLGKAIEWLCGKANGASILCMYGAGNLFDTKFQQALGELGHSYTETGSGTEFSGYEPLDFDIFIMNGPPSLGESYHGLTAVNDKMDYLMDNDCHILAPLTANVVSLFSRWGLTGSGLTCGHSNPWQWPTDEAIFDLGTTVYVPSGTAYQCVISAGSKGGTPGAAECNTHSGKHVFGWWY